MLKKLNLDADGTKGRRGTSGRNQFRLNNITNNWNAIVAKRTKLFSDRNNLELLIKAFNLFNTTRFTEIGYKKLIAGIIPAMSFL